MCIHACNYHKELQFMYEIFIRCDYMVIFHKVSSIEWHELVMKTKNLYVVSIPSNPPHRLLICISIGHHCFVCILHVLALLMKLFQHMFEIFITIKCISKIKLVMGSKYQNNRVHYNLPVRQSNRSLLLYYKICLFHWCLASPCQSRCILLNDLQSMIDVIRFPSSKKASS